MPFCAKPAGIRFLRTDIGLFLRQLAGIVGFRVEIDQRNAGFLRGFADAGAADVSVNVMTMASTPAAMKLLTWFSCLEMSVWASSTCTLTPPTCDARAVMPSRKSVWKLLSKLCIETPIVSAKAPLPIMAARAAAKQTDFMSSSVRCRITPIALRKPDGLLAEAWPNRGPHEPLHQPPPPDRS